MAIYDINGNSLETKSITLPTLDEFARTTLIRHKGGNSASDFATAYSNGYRAVEGDVRFTSDSIPIMAHDATLGGLTIASSTLAQLQDATTVYTLDDWFCDCRKYNVLAEIDFTKTYTSAQCAILVEYIEKWGMQGRCTIEAYPATSASDLVSNSTDLILSLMTNTTTSEIDAQASFENSCRRIICIVAHESATQSLVTYAHSKGYLVRCWTGGTGSTNDVAYTKTLINLGVDFVITDSCKPSDLTPST